MDIGSFPNTVNDTEALGRWQNTRPPKIPESFVPMETIQLWHCILVANAG